MRLKYFLFIALFAALSCKNNEPYAPYSYNGNPQYTWGFTQFYGKYYSNYNLQDGVHSVSLFTKNLTVDNSRELIGAGQYLELNDVFVNPADTILPTGTYNLTDTITADTKPFTFLKGKEFKDGNTPRISGAVIYYFEEDASKNKIKYITEGSFTVTRQNDIFTINCNFKTDDKKELKGVFTGKLYHYDQTSKLSGTKKKGMKFSH